MAIARKASSENSATRMDRKGNRLFDGAATAVGDFMRGSEKSNRKARGINAQSNFGARAKSLPLRCL